MDDLEKAKQLFFAALSRQQRGALADAARLYEDALALAPERPSIMSNLAAVYVLLKRYAAARALCERCLAIDPQDQSALMHLGICFSKTAEPTAALALFDRVLLAQPDSVAALVNRATALLALGRADDALASADLVLAASADHVEALNTRGNALLKLGRAEDALAAFERALEVDPASVDVSFNLAATLLRWGREDEANDIYRRAIAARPNSAELNAAYGDVLRFQYRKDSAIEHYERALQLDPACAQARYGLANVRLLERDYARGWPGNEERLNTTDYRERSFRKRAESVTAFERLPRWRGPTQVGGGEVAIWAEQGIGDEILFSTLIPELIDASVPFSYELDKRLIGLYRRAFPDVRFVARDDPPQAVLQQAASALACGSLPSFFRRAHADFARQPAKLLRADPERVAFFRQRLEALGAGRKVAIAWRSAREDWWSRKKNTSLNALVPLLKTPGVHFVDVQFGDTGAERSAAEASANVSIARFDEIDYFNDLEALFALLEACDLVITTSNATAHFAGALGVPTWVLYLADQAPFHYWAHGEDYRSAWYPSVESVTAPELRNWRALIDFAAGKLAARVAR